MFARMKRLFAKIKKKRLVYLLSLGLLALLTGLTVLFLSLRASDLRLSSDYQFMKDFLKGAEEDYFYRLALPHVEETVTPYENVTLVKQNLADALHPDAITFARADGYTKDKPAYTLYADSRVAFTVLLERKGSLSGRPSWRIASITHTEHCGLASKQIVEVPHGATLTVNGVPVDRADATPAPYHALSAFEDVLADTYYADRYELGSFYVTPTLIAELNGERLRADAVTAGTVCFAYPASYTTTATLTVPYGSHIHVNGKDVSSAYLAQSGIPYPFLTRFEIDLPLSLTSVVYQISGLFQTPEILVTNGDAVLTSDGKGAYRLPEENTKSVVVVAPTYATVKLNGVSVGLTEATVLKEELPIMEGVSGYAKDRPYLTRYTISGLLNDPIITAVDQYGRSLSVSPYYSNDGQLLFSCTPGSTVPDREKLTLRTFARLYVIYVYSAYNGMNAHYSDVSSMAPSNSPAYSTLRSTFYKLYNADRHSNISVGTVEFLEYYPYSTTTYSAILKIPFTTTLDGKQLTHEMIMDVLYVYSGSIRRIVNYKVLSTVTAETS